MEELLIAFSARAVLDYLLFAYPHDNTNFVHKSFKIATIIVRHLLDIGHKLRRASPSASKQHGERPYPILRAFNKVCLVSA
jgi:hypothetical protein